MTAPQDRFKRRLAKLIEACNEMALNADDGDFCRGGGADKENEIHYVFDESVFEFFINPDDSRRKYPAFFHLEPWRDNGRNDETYWVLVNQMLSVLTAEYLFSGDLPGQKGERILMTYGHRYELGRRYNTLLTGINPVPGRAKLHYENVKRARDRIRDLPDGGDMADRRLVQDLNNVPQDDRPAFLRARRLARAFAEEKDLLAPAQLQRFAREQAHRIQDVTYQFPLTPKDVREIDVEAARWEQDLRLHLAARPRADRQDKTAGLRRDARALAMIQHIARGHLDKDERIVFVTGDSLMLEVYWNWYSDAYIRDPSEPNIIRSVGRFSPLMNLSDMMKPGMQSVSAFDLLKVALNLAIQPWRMTAHDSLAKVDPQRIANLWYLRQQILDSIDDPDIFPRRLFENNLTDDKFDESDREFEKVRDLYQTLERNASRAGLDLLERRRASLLSLEATDAPVIGDEESAMAYFRGLAQDLVSENARLWLPIARDFLVSEHQSQPADPHYRPAITLLLSVSAGDAGDAPAENIIDFERRLARVSPDELAYLERFPHVIFTLGALFSIRRKLWSDADVYAGLAKTAFRTIKVSGADPANQEPDYQELRFLRAVCARMLMGSIHKPRSPSGQRDVGAFHDPWAPIRARAELNLKDCLAYHVEHDQFLRQARALSELASVNLFYATWRIVHRPRFLPHGQLHPSAEFTRQAASDLLAAFRIVSTENEDAIVDPDRRAMLRGVRRQVLANLAAIDGFTRRLPELEPVAAEIQAELSDALEIVAELLPREAGSEFPFVVRQEVVDFLQRRGRPVPEAWRTPGRTTLQIDNEILRIFALPLLD